jgi:hypothetical protein
MIPNHPQPNPLQTNVIAVHLAADRPATAADAAHRAHTAAAPSDAAETSVDRALPNHLRWARNLNPLQTKMIADLPPADSPVVAARQAHAAPTAPLDAIAPTGPMPTDHRQPNLFQARVIADHWAANSPATAADAAAQLGRVPSAAALDAAAPNRAEAPVRRMAASEFHAGSSAPNHPAESGSAATTDWPVAPDAPATAAMSAATDAAAETEAPVDAG